MRLPLALVAGALFAAYWRKKPPGTPKLEPGESADNQPTGGYI